MKEFKDIKEFPNKATAVTFGKFDGLHVGHQKLIESIVGKKAAGLVPTVFSFAQPPRAYFEKREMSMLLTKEEREQALQDMKVELLFEYPVNKASMSVEAREFVQDVIKKRLHASFIAVGEDFRFGAGRRGDVSLLQKMAQSCGYELEIIEKQQIEGAPVSSSRIRKLLEAGQLELANQFLGYAYSITGEIVRGNQLGRTWNIPTINLQWPAQKIAPMFGVYFSSVEIEGRQWQGVTNIGRKPSIAGTYPIGAETYLYQCNEELYGKTATVSLMQFHRKEQKFDSLELLIAQLHRDIEAGKRSNCGENCK